MNLSLITRFQELLKLLLHETFSYVPAQEWASIWIARDGLFNQSVGLSGSVMEGGEKGPFRLWRGAMMRTDVSGNLYTRRELSLSILGSSLSGICPLLGCKLLAGDTSLSAPFLHGNNLPMDWRHGRSRLG